MTKRRFIMLVTAAVVAAACALPALAWGREPVTTSSTPPPGGWTLTLKGKRTKVLPIANVPARFSWDGAKAGDINPNLLYVYRGQLLYKLLGKVDDFRSGFNVRKAKRGYRIRLVCRDGYRPTFSSKILFKKNGKLRTDLIIAKIKAGELLPEGEAPFRFVGGPPVTQPFNNKLSAYGIVKIRLIF